MKKNKIILIMNYLLLIYIYSQSIQKFWLNFIVFHIKCQNMRIYLENGKHMVSAELSIDILINMEYFYKEWIFFL